MAVQLVITPSFEDDERQIITEHINPGIEVHFLASADKDEHRKMLKQADVMLTLNPGQELHKDEFELLAGIKFIQLVSAGADHVPYDKIPRDIPMASNIGAYARPMAEHVLAMTLALAKRLKEEDHNMRKGEFNQMTLNKSIRDSTVGILGFGGIGQATADLFRPLGARIFAMNTSGKTDETVDFVGTSDDLPHILKSSDVLVLSLPLNEHTRGMIGKKQLETMKKDAILINVARGEIINQKALYEFLRDHPDFKAGLESWWIEPLRHGTFELDYPLLDLPNVLASPHNSAVVPGASNRALAEAVENINHFLEDEPYRGTIDRTNFG